MERVKFTEAMEAEYMGPCEAGYPAGGFLDFAFQTLGVTDPDKVLHFFAGGVKGGTTVDLRPETDPTVCCDVAHTPFDDASFDWIMADSPISEILNQILYGLPHKLPKDEDVLAEAKRLLRSGGKFGLLHPIVPVDIEGLVREKTYAVITEPGRIVGGWHVMRRT